jgi:RNA polymerase sigma-32 factor
LFFNLRKAKKNLAWLTFDETQAVAKDLGVSPQEVTEMEKRLHARDAIFDPAPDVDDERAFTPAAYLPSPDADPAKLVETADFNDDASVRMAAAIRTLDDRSRHIIESRWLSEDKLTLHELADEYGISAERVRQVEANAIKKLRSAMAL